MQNFEVVDLTPGLKTETVEIEETINVGVFDPTNDQFRVERRDLTLTNSISAALQPLITEMGTLSINNINHFQQFQELKLKVANIFNDKSVCASEKTRKKWKIQLEKQNNLDSLLRMMSNIVLAGADLKVGLDNY